MQFSPKTSLPLILFSLLSFVLELIVTPGIAIAKDTILLEDFEDSSITYVADPVDDLLDISARNYFGRIAPDTDTPPPQVEFTNRQGSGYYGAEDADSTFLRPTDLITLDWVAIDVSSHTDLELSFFIAEDDSENGNEDWDDDSSFRISTQLDGGGFSQVFGVEAEFGDGDGFNHTPRIDTNFDGIGDGAEITDVFTQYMVSIADGSTLDIRVEIERMTTLNEDIAFDNLQLTGIQSVPEPGTGMILAGVSLITMIRRRR